MDEWITQESSKRILIKFYGRVGHGPIKNWLCGC